MGFLEKKPKKEEVEKDEKKLVEDIQKQKQRIADLEEEKLDFVEGIDKPEEDKPEAKPEEQVRVVSDCQLINIKIDQIGDYINKLDASFKQLDDTIKKAMED